MEPTAFEDEITRLKNKIGNYELAIDTYERALRSTDDCMTSLTLTELSLRLQKKRLSAYLKLNLMVRDWILADQDNLEDIESYIRSEALKPARGPIVR